MAVLERTKQLAELHEHLIAVIAGTGRLVLLGGEAGVGKSTLVEAFCHQADQDTKVLVGVCDPLSTPRPLGPLYDMVPGLDHDIEQALGSGKPQASLFPLVLRNLTTDPRPALIVFEDAHWADDATLDLLRYLARRIQQTRTMLLVTYRDDEVGPRHPLRMALGHLANSPAVYRMSLSPLSRQAVEQLSSGSHLDPKQLYEQTGGNPFFVTEILATASATVPATVVDAVLSRASGLGADGRAMLDAVAILGPRAEVVLLPQMVQRSPEQALPALDDAIHTGILRADGDIVSFRHELARQAILETLSGPQRTVLHARALDLLRQPAMSRVDHARLAHYAEAAGDKVATLEYALVAARTAESLSAHREALAQYKRAVRVAGFLPDERRVVILEQASFEAYLAGEIPAALSLRREAVELRERLNDMIGMGRDLRHLARVLSVSGNAPEAMETAQRAIDILESMESGPELAMAYSCLSQLLMLAGDHVEAIKRGQQAIHLAERLNARVPLIHALNNVGVSRIRIDDSGGYEDLLRSLDLALEHNMDDDVARAYVNIAGAAIRQFDFDAAVRYLTEGLDYCTERGIEQYRLALLSRLAHVQLYRGEWADAEKSCGEVLHGTGTIIGPEIAIAIQSLIHARRGVENAHQAIRHTIVTTRSIGHAWFSALLSAANAECAWLAGEDREVVDELRAEIKRSVSQKDKGIYAPLSAWLRIIGGPENLPVDLPPLNPPYSLMVDGKWISAAAAWEALGCPYETALCLLEAGDEPALRRALALFEDLGAHPAASKATRRLQAMGARNISRGPRKSTRETPGNLTARELEVFHLLAAGLSNVDIADRLFLSPNTVGHHVSAILAKLDARSRSEAAAIGTRMGLDRHATHG